MPVIALVSNKGGAGKTTLSVNIACGLAKQKRVVIVDADPQGSSLQWRAFSEKENAIKVVQAADELHGLAQKLLLEYDYVVFDCPPSVHAPQTVAVLKLCHLALIPVQPSPVDLWATVHIENAVEQAREDNPELDVRLVINQLESRTALSRLVRDAINEIEMPAAETAIKRRAIYRNCLIDGRSVFEMGKQGSSAAAEIQQLIDEVIR